jgi:arginine utilization protein RocB
MHVHETRTHLEGRGVLDMKSGIAVAMEMMAWWSKPERRPRCSVLLVATCDEEVGSRGILSALDVLIAMKSTAWMKASGRAGRGGPKPTQAAEAIVRKLTGGGSARSRQSQQSRQLIGALNVDYTGPIFAGDPSYRAWNGTVGKILAGVYVRGVETHAGEYFNGYHASALLSRIVADVDGDPRYSGASPPPATLKLSDGKSAYDVMTSASARAYFNLFTTGRTPASILRAVRRQVATIAKSYGRELQGRGRAHLRKSGIDGEVQSHKAKVLLYSELVKQVAKVRSQAAVSRIEREVAGDGASGANTDPRELGFRMIEKLVDALGEGGPVIVVSLLPPYYPYVRPDRGRFASGVRRATSAEARGAGIKIDWRPWYPYISDMSYLRLEPELGREIGAVMKEMPGWGRWYELEIEKVRGVNLPVVNVGPHGTGAHQPGERVEKRYTFTVLPHILQGVANRDFRK